MTDVELRERRERIATAVMAALHANSDPGFSGEPAYVLALIAVDAADALIEELDKGDID